MTRRRSGESRDDGGRVGRWAAATVGDGRGGGADDTGGAAGCKEGPALRLRPRRRVRARGVGVATTTRRDVVETTTRSSGDDGAGAMRRASGSDGRVAIPRDTPRAVLPHMLPQSLHVAPEPRYPKCSPEPLYRKLNVTPNPTLEPCWPKCHPRAALPQM